MTLTLVELAYQSNYLLLTCQLQVKRSPNPRTGQVGFSYNAVQSRVDLTLHAS